MSISEQEISVELDNAPYLMYKCFPRLFMNFLRTSEAGRLECGFSRNLAFLNL